MYVEKGESTEKVKVPTAFIIGIAICVAFVIILGVYPDLIFGYCESAASVLFGF